MPHTYIKVGPSNILSISVAGKLNLELKRYKEAEVYYKELLMRNPENTTYYARLQEAQQLTTASEKLNMFSEFQELFPRALAPRRLPLTYAAGGFFKGVINHT
jgi:peptide alpha-N-acetyltransferase